MDDSDPFWRAIHWVSNHIPELGTTAFYTLCIMAIITIVRETLMKRRQREPNQNRQPSNEVDNSRKLCKIESSIDLLHKFGGSITANVLLVKSRVSLQTSVVRQALNHLTKMHPLLRTRIDRTKVQVNGRKRMVKHFREMENHDFAEYHLRLKQTTADQWLAVFERELQKQFPVEGPLWRFVMLKEQFDPVEGRYSNAFVFSTHHLICDGISSFTFFMEFLEYLNQGHSDEECDTITYKVLPSFSYLMRKHISMSQLATLYEASKLLFQSLFQRFQTKPSHQNIFTTNYPPVILSNPTLLKKTCLLPRTVNQEELSQLVMMCKSKQCTVHGAFTAAAAISMATMLRDELSSEQPKTIPASFQVNIRNNCDPEVEPDHFGCYFVNCPIEIPVGNYIPESVFSLAWFWEVAQRSSRIIHTAIAKGDHVHSAQLTNVLKSTQNRRLGPLSKDINVAGRTSALFSISNLNQYKVPETTDGQSFGFDGFYYAVAEHNVGPVFAHNIATINGVLYWGITYHTNVVTEKQAKCYAKLVIDTLRYVVSND